MKRSLLIAGGTVGGLGAVLAVTPPQFTSSSTEMALPSAPASSTSTPSATATQAATPKASATPSSTATVKKKSSTKTATTKTTTATPTPAATTAAPTTSTGKSGKFLGSLVDIQYGDLQVEITVVNGKITDAKAVVVPSARNDRWTNMAVPVLRQQTLAAQSAKIQGVSGASYTSYGWYTSLVSALSKAGL